MPFPEIQLDDRRFEDLFHEAKRRISAYTPEWTDHNESDPGITLLQLFTWLQEMVIWRLNRVPEKSYLKFLDMIGIELIPSAAAQADLTFQLSLKDTSKSIVIPRGSKVSLAEAGEDGPVIFETDESLHAAPVELKAIQVFDGAQFTLISPETLTAGQSFQPFGSDPQQNAALYLGFSAAFPAAERFKLRIYAAQPAAEGFFQSDHNITSGEALPVSGSWEYSSTSNTWKPLSQVIDSSLALSRSGWMEFQAPTDAQPRKLGALIKPADAALFWFRFRIRQVLGSGFERTPELEQVLVNTVSATNAVTEELELLGASNGRPNQVFRLAHAPVLPMEQGETGIIEVDEGDGKGFQLWVEVADFDGSQRDDKHYVLRRATGEVFFGDGEHGKIPRWLPGDPSKSESADLVNIRVRRYRWGGGARGNAGPKKITSLQSPVPYVQSVTNFRDARGGRNEETVAEATERAPLQLRTGLRAVTMDDFAFLAKQTPGAEIARAQAFPLLHPKYRLKRSSVTGEALPEVPIPGVVTIVVVPHSDQSQPLPTEQTLRLVGNYLDQHRLVTSELYVAPPRYRKVEIQTTVVADPAIAATALEQSLKQRLLDYFHPLKGGTDRNGWSFGGTIYFSSTYREILSMPGIVRIEGDLITIVDDEIQQPCTDILLDPDELAYSEDHVVKVVYQ